MKRTPFVIAPPKDKASEVHEKAEKIRANPSKVHKTATILPQTVPKNKICPDLIKERNCDCPEECNVQNAPCDIFGSIPLVDEGACTVKRLAMTEAEGAEILAPINPLQPGCAKFKRIAPALDGTIAIVDTPDQIILSALPADCPVTNVDCSDPGESFPLFVPEDCAIKRLVNSENPNPGAAVIGGFPMDDCVQFRKISPLAGSIIGVTQQPSRIDLSTRFIGFLARRRKTTLLVTPAVNNLTVDDWDSVIESTIGSFNLITGVFTVQESGWYNIGYSLPVGYNVPANNADFPLVDSRTSGIIRIVNVTLATVEYQYRISSPVNVTTNNVGITAISESFSNILPLQVNHQYKLEINIGGTATSGISIAHETFGFGIGFEPANSFFAIKIAEL